MSQIAKWLNAFPSMDALDQPSPARLVSGDGKPNYKMRRVEFGAYAMVYVGTSNNMESRAVPCIAMDESNIFGGHRFLSLESGKVLHSNKWVCAPMDEFIIERIEELATKQNQPVMEDRCPLFEIEPGDTLNFEEDDEVGDD